MGSAVYVYEMAKKYGLKGEGLVKRRIKHARGYYERGTYTRVYPQEKGPFFWNWMYGGIILLLLVVGTYYSINYSIKKP